jgi:hypothetical protein
MAAHYATCDEINVGCRLLVYRKAWSVQILELIFELYQVESPDIQTPLKNNDHARFNIVDERPMLVRWGIYLLEGKWGDGEGSIQCLSLRSHGLAYQAWIVSMQR